MAEAKKADGGDAGQREAQTKADEAGEEGVLGVKVDPTPNENYTFAGAAAGKPTPETDPKAAEDVRKAAAERRGR